MAYRFANRMKELKSSPLRENASKNMELKDVILFAYGFPPMEAFPMETLQKISQKLYTEVDPETFLVIWCVRRLSCCVSWSKNGWQHR